MTLKLSNTLQTQTYHVQLKAEPALLRAGLTPDKTETCHAQRSKQSFANTHFSLLLVREEWCFSSKEVSTGPKVCDCPQSKTSSTLAPKLKPVGVGWPSCNQACDGKQQPLDKGQRPPAPESPEKPPACLAGRISMSQRTGLNLEAMLQMELVPALQGRQVLCERKLNTQNA